MRPSLDDVHSAASSGRDFPSRPIMASPSRDSSDAACCIPNCGFEVTWPTPIMRVLEECVEESELAGVLHPLTIAVRRRTAARSLAVSRTSRRSNGLAASLFLRQRWIIDHEGAVQVL